MVTKGPTKNAAEKKLEALVAPTVLPPIRPNQGKGHKPIIDRFACQGYVTDRLNVCLGCENPDYRAKNGKLAPLYRIPMGSPKAPRLYTHFDHKQMSIQALMRLLNPPTT